MGEELSSLENSSQQNREFYKRLFSEDDNWATRYPNSDEAARWSQIVQILSALAARKRSESKAPLRILDVGCGRGWLTHLASIFGHAEGVDPVPESIQTARGLFPQIAFHVGTAKGVSQSGQFMPFDVVVASEVMEHVFDKGGLVGEMIDCIEPGGHLIVTTPRREWFEKWTSAGFELQPVERWLSEKEVEKLFRSLGFQTVYRDRIYLDFPRLSFLHRLGASQKVANVLGHIRLYWVRKAIQYLASIYQIWCFQYIGKKCWQ
jgi:2-polyprenyl-3-methyl-5-hydroxy-6-metoxy-1,4-benzoquinol methylase